MGKKHKKHHKSEKSEKKHHEDKPLKLVLKVGVPESQDPYTFPPVEEKVHLEKHKKAKKKKKKKSSEREREKEKDDKKQKHHHRHHHHDKKKSKKRDRDIYESDRDILDEFREPAQKKVALEPLPERARTPRACTLKGSDDDLNPIQQLLHHLLKMLQRKDQQQFFAWPVNDIIAPGYSSIISHPMDISTMREKIDNNEYSCVNEFKLDLKLMCDNATTYNRPETIYYKAAKRLLHVGMKLMNKEKLMTMKRNLPFMSKMGKDELGFEDDGELEPVDVGVQALEEEENIVVKETKKKSKTKTNIERQVVLTDNLSPSEILAQVQQAAKEVADRLRQVKPKSKIGFLRRQKDGSTTLAILNGNADYNVKERHVNLEMLTGKLNQGTGTLGGFKEDKRNKANPMSYLNYGSFSSYAPSYDSTFSNLTKEESDLLYYTYGDETGVQYAQRVPTNQENQRKVRESIFCKNVSIVRYVQDSGNFVTTMVDNLLNLLTGGEHSKTIKVITDRKSEEKKVQEQTKKVENEKQFHAEKIVNNCLIEENVDSLRSLSELGIDMSFLDSMDALTSNTTAGEDSDSKKNFQEPLQNKLDQTASLLQELDKTQHDRLSQKPPPHLAHIKGPSDGEVLLAGRVTDSLKVLASQVTPSDLVSVRAVRSSMGITAHPIESLEDASEMNVVDKAQASVDVKFDHWI